MRSGFIFNIQHVAIMAIHNTYIYIQICTCNSYKIATSLKQLHFLIGSVWIIYLDLSQSWGYLQNLAEQVDLFIAGILKNVQQNHTLANILAKHLCLHLSTCIECSWPCSVCMRACRNLQLFLSIF